MADQKLHRRFKIRSYGILIPISCVLLVIAMVFSCLHSAIDVSVGLFLLFLLPVVVQIFGLFVLDGRLDDVKERSGAATNQNPSSAPETAGAETVVGSNVATTEQAAEDSENNRSLIHYSTFYSTTMALCLVSYSVLWIIYALGQKYVDWENADKYVQGNLQLGLVWSWVFTVLTFIVLSIIVILLFMVMWMTRAIISDREFYTRRRFKFLNLYDLKRCAAQAPFLTLIFFLTVFLGVSYLFGFALAFHDKSQLYRGEKNERIGEPALIMRTLLATDQASKPQPPLSPDPGATSSPTPNAKFWFDSGRAEFKDNGIKDGEKNNADQLKAVLADIRDKAAKDSPVRVTLIGGADLRQINGFAYQSNYELAEARAQQVKRKILGDLSSPDDWRSLHNVEWICLANPKEGRVEHNAAAPLKDDEGQYDRDVKVFVEQKLGTPVSLFVRANNLKPLNLMDYVYFSNYTITTTGYGDIVPNTAYTKFICSFANICEVVFLVVFFNALLSLSGYQKMSTMGEQVNDLHTKHGSNRRSGKR